MKKYILTVRMLVQDYSPGDAIGGVTDVINNANIQHWLLDHVVDGCKSVDTSMMEIQDSCLADKS